MLLDFLWNTNLETIAGIFFYYFYDSLTVYFFKLWRKPFVYFDRWREWCWCLQRILSLSLFPRSFMRHLSWTTPQREPCGFQQVSPPSIVQLFHYRIPFEVLGEHQPLLMVLYCPLLDLYQNCYKLLILVKFHSLILSPSLRKRIVHNEHRQ